MVFRLRLTIEQQLERQSMHNENVQGEWSEFVNDLWQHQLPHLRYEVAVSAIDPPVEAYGFQEETYHSPENELMNDLSDAIHIPQKSSYTQDIGTDDDVNCSSSEDEDANTDISQTMQYYKAKEIAQIPFMYHQILKCDRNEQLLTITEHDITLKIPEGAVADNDTFHLEVAVAMYAPIMFGLSENIQPVSPVLWLCPLQTDTKLMKPFQIVLPHFLAGLSEDKAKQYSIGFAQASHDCSPLHDDQNSICYNFKPCATQIEFTSTGCKSYGILTTQDCCLYCIKANKIPQIATDAKYCLVCIERLLTPSITELSFAAIYFLSTCFQVGDLHHS